MVIRARVPARAADVLENARAAAVEEGKERRRRKEDILMVLKRGLDLGP